MCTIFFAHAISWTMGDDAGGFRVTLTSAPGQSPLDDACIEALGLKNQSAGYSAPP